MTTTHPSPIRDPHALLDRYAQVRSATESLAAPLSPEDQTVQSMPDVSPTKWHRAHVTWFFETFVLAENEPEFEPFQDTYWFLFNSYYETVGPRYARAERGVISRPGAHDVGVYRGNVDERMRGLLDRMDEGSLSKAADTIELGFHHEQQHQELLLMDIKHVLSLNPLMPAYAGTPSAAATPDPLGWVDFEGGLVEIGHEGEGFSFDNELPRHQQLPRAVPAGRPARHQRRVAGVHHRRRLPAPRALALRRLGAGQRRGLGRAVLLDRDRRSLVRAHPQRHLARQPRAAGEPRQLLRGGGLRHLGRQAVAERGGVGARRDADAHRRARRARQPRRPDHLPPARSRRASGGLRQMYGDCWEWTSSAYHPYPGFHPPTGAIGEYNGKFMSNQMVLRGGCAFTPAGHARATYRNFFPHGSRWALSGVRLAEGQVAA